MKISIILSLQKAGKPSLKFAWLLDKLKVERDRNHSIDSKSRRVETSVYNMVVIDCPGHRNYVHNMITGISQVTSSAKIHSFLPKFIPFINVSYQEGFQLHQ